MSWVVVALLGVIILLQLVIIRRVDSRIDEAEEETDMLKKATIAYAKHVNSEIVDLQRVSANLFERVDILEAMLRAPHGEC